MAFGDPMVLATLYNGGAANTNHDSLLIDGPMDRGAPGSWSWETDIATPTVSVQFGARTGGSGSEFHRLTFSSPGSGVLGYYRQSIALRGHSRLGNYGHQGQIIFAYMFAKRNDATGGTVTATVQITETAIGVSSGSQQVGMATGTWYNLSAQRTIGALSNVFEIRIKLEYSGAGSPVIDLDEAALYLSYTFALNPTVPDDPDFFVPDEKFARTVNGSLLAYGPLDVGAAKMRYQMNFGQCGLDQLKSLRSLWLLRAPLRWTTNLPHLPEYVDCRIVGKSFPFAMHRTSVARNLYHGSLTLEEI